MRAPFFFFIAVLFCAQPLFGKDKDKNKKAQLFDVQPMAIFKSPVLELPFSFDPEYIRQMKITKLKLLCADSSNETPTSDTITFFFRSDGQLEKMRQFKKDWLQWVYNDKGQLDYQIAYGTDTTHYFYDQSGLLIRTEKAAGKAPYRYIDNHWMRYGKNGLVCDSARFFMLCWDYDAAGRVSARYRDNSGKKEKEDEFSYDAQGRWVSSGQYSELKYDASGRLLLYRMMNPATQNNDIYTLKYDASGKMKSIDCQFRGAPNDQLYRHLTYYAFY